MQHDLSTRWIQSLNCTRSQLLGLEQPTGQAVILAGVPIIALPLEGGLHADRANANGTGTIIRGRLLSERASIQILPLHAVGPVLLTHDCPTRCRHFSGTALFCVDLSRSRVRIVPDVRASARRRIVPKMAAVADESRQSRQCGGEHSLLGLWIAYKQAV